MTAQDDAAPQDNPAQPGSDDAPDGFAVIEKLQAELAETKDRALRAVAELENYRRRAEKEREDTAKYAITGFAREMLTVADNLRRALESQPAGLPDSLKPFISGVELTERELNAIFERAGIVRVSPEGQAFNHDLHQAMFEVEDASKPAGTVVQVLQAGYTLKDRLLRPAMVGVSKGGVSAAANAQTGGYGAASGDPHNVDTKA
ncbi:MAG TPA: nucleotide exchange factor GrpE [Alphaproteobacteria bacterium]|jgi:molecular chaperone GrpE